METRDIEIRLNEQILRLEKLKEEMESRANEAIFEEYDLGRERSFVGPIDSETAETYAIDSEKLKRVIHKKGFGLNNRRSEMEIIATILDTAMQGVNKTNILYQANLSYVQLKNYVGFLLEKDLLERVESTYSTTKKGKLFLVTWQNTLMLLE